ncbi:MAG: phenylacetic acid degradation operon negative regulatory protein PaaX [Pusillimonas sp.]
MHDTQPTLQRLIHTLLERDPPRAKSLCVTLLGDAIEPHGGSIWLSSLIELVTPLGINERLLRTSVFRLVAQDWLQSERHGRRSLYRLSEHGRELTRQASAHIYDGATPHWQGNWTLVVLPRFGNASLSKRGEVRRELIWAGFGALAPGVFALPRDHSAAAHKVLGKLKLSDHALVLGAHEMNEGKGLLIGDLIAQCWDMDGVAGQYQNFQDTFGPMLAAIGDDMRPSQAYAVRALTLHEWRRIVLHDPQLPQQMLPPDWPGHAARKLCGTLYWRVFEQAEAHLDEVLGQDPERYQPIKPYAYQRFGGRDKLPGSQAA